MSLISIYCIRWIWLSHWEFHQIQQLLPCLVLCYSSRNDKIFQLAYKLKRSGEVEYFHLKTKYWDWPSALPLQFSRLYLLMSVYVESNGWKICAHSIKKPIIKVVFLLRVWNFHIIFYFFKKLANSQKKPKKESPGSIK